MRYSGVLLLLVCCAAGCSSGPVIKDANYYYARGVQLAENDHFEEATQCFKKVVALKPNHPTAHYNLGVIYDEKVMPQEAIAEYRRAIQIDPRSYEAWYKLGILEGLEGNDDEAVRCFQEVIKIEPKHQGAHYNLAVLFGERGNEAQSVEEYRKVIELNPENFQALNNLGLYYARKAQYDQASNAFRQAKRANPAFCDAYNNLGIVCVKKGDYESAAAQFEKAVEINKKNADGFYNLAYIYKDHLHEYRKAERAIEAYLQLKPDAPQAAELRKSLRDIRAEMEQVKKELYAQKSESIRKDVTRFIEHVSRKNFIDFYDFQPDEMRKHVSRQRWQRDLIEMTEEMRLAQKKSVLELLGFAEDIDAFQITGIEMLSAKKAKVTLKAASQGEWRETSCLWDECNGRWAPAKFINRIRINWESAKSGMAHAGD